MKLHEYGRSSASYRVRIALNLKGISYESVGHDLLTGGHRLPEYLAIDPQGFVPALEDDGEIILQSMAILEYLEETGPEPLLLPGHPADRARVRGLAQIIVADIHPLNNVRIRSYVSAEMGQDEASWLKWYAHWIVEGFNALETLLREDERTGRFCHGDEITLADVCLVPQVVNALRFNIDLAPFPTIRRIFDACMQVPAFEKAHPKNQPGAS